jgi:hypothetical protein
MEGFNWVRTGSINSCQHDNETSNYIKIGEFLGQLAILMFVRRTLPHSGGLLVRDNSDSNCRRVFEEVEVVTHDSFVNTECMCVYIYSHIYTYLSVMLNNLNLSQY